MTSASAVKLTHVRDVRIKRLLYLYLSFATESESAIWLQIMNSIQNDLADPDPNTRLAALLFLTDSLSLSQTMTESRVSGVRQCLQDKSPYVRRCAIAGISKLFQIFSLKGIEYEGKQTMEYISSMIYYEEDPAVITGCLHALQLCQSNVSRHAPLFSLLSRLELVENWTKAEILSLFSVLTTPSKMTPEEIFSVLNLVDTCLNEKYPLFLSMMCISIMLKVSAEFRSVHADVTMRVAKCLLKELKVLRPDMCDLFFIVLNAVSSSLDMNLAEHFSDFLLLESDSAVTRLHKLKLLQRSCTKENAGIVMKQLMFCCLATGHTELKAAAVEILFTLYKYLPTQCCACLHSLLNHDECTILDAAVGVLHKIKVSCPEYLLDDRAAKLTGVYRKLSSGDSKSACLRLAVMKTEHANVRSLVAILHDEVNKWDAISSVTVKLSVLKAVLACYFVLPKSVLPLLRAALNSSVKDPDWRVRRMGKFYCAILRRNVNFTRHIISHRQSPPPAGDHPDVFKLQSMDLLTLSRSMLH